MARGFESKDVEFQQAEAERQKTLTRGRNVGDRHGDIVELSLCRVRAEQLSFLVVRRGGGQ